MTRNGRTPEWPIDPEVPEPRGPVAPKQHGFNPVLIALGGLLLVGIVLWLVTGNRNPDQDKLTNRHQSSSGAPSPEKLCASSATYDLIKRDLFRRAAQLRGSDQAAFDRLASAAVVRMENPVMESANASTNAVQCSGSLSLDLPPGVGVVGGRRTLTADVVYTVQSAADGSGNVVLLRNADAIITPLATLAKIDQPQASAPVSSTVGSDESEAPESTETPPPASSPPREQPIQPTAQTPVRTVTRPSFNCAYARSRGEIAICNDADLAALDRAMAAEFSRALSGAPESERALLRDTRTRFLRYRDRCADRACIADAYKGRIREIRDIAQGRWQPR